MNSKSDFFQGLCLKARPTEFNGTNRLRISNPNSLLVRSNLSLNFVGGYPTNVSSSTFSSNLNENVFTRSQSSSLLTANGSPAVNNNSINNSRSTFRAPYVLPPKPAGLVINLMPKIHQLRHIRQKITSRQLQNIVQMKRILNAHHQNNQRNVNNSNDQHQQQSLPPLAPLLSSPSAYPPSSTLTQSPNRLQQHPPLLYQHHNQQHHHHHSNSYLNSAVNEAKASLAVNSKNEAKLRERRAKFLKHLCKLEFSSLLFRKVYFRVNSLTNKINYEQILDYEQYCGTSNKNSIKQNLYKTHLLKCKTSRSRTRMLRSSEIVNGKLTDTWQRGSDYAHIYTFGRRQRLKRYQQIQLNLGFQKRILRLVYQRMEITLPKLLECPACKEKLDADRGHCCARRKMRRVKGVSLLSKQKQQPKHNKAFGQNLMTGSLCTDEDDDLVKNCGGVFGSSAIRGNQHRNNHKSGISNNNNNNTSTPNGTKNYLPTASGSGFGNTSITQSTTLMSIQQDKTEYYDYRPEQLGLLPDSVANESFGSDMDGDDINIVKVVGPVKFKDGTGQTDDGRPRRKCNSTLLLDSSNFKDNSSPLVIKRVPYDSDLNQIKVSMKNSSNEDDDIKVDAIQLRRIKPSQCASLCTNRVQSRMIQMTHENLLPVDKTVEVSYE